jgi:hypothetical protein
MDSCGGSQKRTIGSANQTVEMEVECMYNEAGFLCHRETNSDLEPQGQCTGGRLRSSRRRMIEEEARIVQKTCSQVRAADENRFHLSCFIEAVCFKVE